MKFIKEYWAETLVLTALVLVIAALVGCETIKEARTVQPRDFEQTLIVAHGNVKMLRDLTAFYANAQKADCVNNPVSDICHAANQIDEQTTDFREQLDLMHIAYQAVSGSVTECKITWEGVELPCESQSDYILSALITLRALLPEGVK